MVGGRGSNGAVFVEEGRRFAAVGDTASVDVPCNACLPVPVDQPSLDAVVSSIIGLPDSNEHFFDERRGRLKSSKLRPTDVYVEDCSLGSQVGELIAAPVVVGDGGAIGFGALGHRIFIFV